MTSAQSDSDLVFADERQASIARLVASRGRVRNSELTELYAVTETTIRKDLTALQDQGLLKRTHGGAIAVKHPVERGLDERLVREHEAKMMIAQLCVAELKPGDAIFIDSGSTTQLIADLLAQTPDPPRPSHLTILTNSIGVAQAVAEVPGIEHVLLGGHLRRVAGSVVGSLALENLDRFVVNVAFIGVSGLSEGGVTVADLEEARLKAAVIGRARTVAAPLDHTKFGTTHFAKICDLADIDVVITDAADEDTRRLCAQHDIRLVEPADDDQESRQ